MEAGVYKAAAMSRGRWYRSAGADTDRYYFRYKEGLIRTAIADPRWSVVHGESENKDRAMDD